MKPKYAEMFGVKARVRNMDEINRFKDFFFLDEIDDKREYISISVGEVWLYFYKEILIGVRDLRKNRFAVMAVENLATKEDGYSHRHEITSKIVERLVDGNLKEVYPISEPIKYLNSDDLSVLAFEWVSSSISQQIDRALNVKLT